MDCRVNHLLETLGAKGPAAFTEALLASIQVAVAEHYGPAADWSRVQRLIRRLGMGAVHEADVAGKGLKVAKLHLEGLEPDLPFHEAQDHPWCAQWAESWREIRAELLQHDNGSLWTAADSEAVRTMTAPEWRILTLLSLGTWVQGARFPRTRAVLEVLAMRPWEVFFARMPPHTKIGAHSDQMNWMLTAHLGLELEEGGSSLTAGQWRREWRKGKVFVCDTSYVHSAENNSDRDRLVLAIRFLHPGCSDEERYALLFLRTFMDLGRSRDARTPFGAA